MNCKVWWFRTSWMSYFESCLASLWLVLTGCISILIPESTEGLLLCLSFLCLVCAGDPARRERTLAETDLSPGLRSGLGLRLVDPGILRYPSKLGARTILLINFFPGFRNSGLVSFPCLETEQESICWFFFILSIFSSSSLNWGHLDPPATSAQVCPCLFLIVAAVEFQW